MRTFQCSEGMRFITLGAIAPCRGDVDDDGIRVVRVFILRPVQAASPSRRNGCGAYEETGGCQAKGHRYASGFNGSCDISLKASHMSMVEREGANLLIESLPADWREARLLGRLQLPEGPTPVLIEKGRVYDVSKLVPTVADAIAHPDRLDAQPRARSGSPGSTDVIVAHSDPAGAASGAAGETERGRNPVPYRFPGHQGQRRHVRHLSPGARHRRTLAGQLRAGRANPFQPVRESGHRCVVGRARLRSRLCD